MNINWEDIETHKYTANWKRFRRCQAWTFYDGENIWIKSYNTIVAVIDSDGALIIRQHYSRTTSKQITMIYNSYRNKTLAYKD